MKLSRLESYYLDLIKGKKQGIFASVLRGILLVFSWIFQGIVYCRNKAFDKGWLRRYSPPVPLVISIGNFVAGGTGKTPVTLMLAQEFYVNYLIAILSRGYRSPAENLPAPLWLSRGQGPMHPASYCGDEPFLLAQNLPKTLVFVGKDRHKSSNMAAKAGAQVILLDDGMQHRRLARDLEVIVIDAGDPFGYGYFLPRGLLREGLKSLSRADLMILNHIVDHDHFIRVQTVIANYSKAPLIGTRMEVAEIVALENRQPLSLKDQVVGLFCGIAHPDYFEATVCKEGARVVGRYIVADHENFDFEALALFAEACRKEGAAYIVCTEKDEVKLKDHPPLALPIVWIKMKLVVVEGEGLWKDFVVNAKRILQKRV
jgi:tetraacyldisaccharide 4'-kinase